MHDVEDPLSLEFRKVHSLVCVNDPSFGPFRVSLISKLGTTAAPPAADEGGAPSNAALSLACIGCYRLPSDMDDEREKHPICDMCRDEKLPTTYLCGVECPGNPGAWQLFTRS